MAKKITNDEQVRALCGTGATGAVAYFPWLLIWTNYNLHLQCGKLPKKQCLQTSLVIVIQNKERIEE